MAKKEKNNNQNKNKKLRPSPKSNTLSKRKTETTKGKQHDNISSRNETSIKAEKTTYNKKTKVGIYIIVFLFAFALYGNTMMHDYVLDDAIVITHNDFVKDENLLNGLKDILTFNSNTSMFGKSTSLNVYGRYRPLSYITYAIEWKLSAKSVEGKDEKEGNPHVSHFVNILLYAFTGMLLFSILFQLFEYYRKSSVGKKSFIAKWYFSVPFITTLLFLAHPVHSEVIANIKSRDEILAFLGVLSTLWFSLQYLKNNKTINLVLLGFVYFLALMSKESSITFLAIIPLVIYFFTKASVKKHILFVASMLVATIVFFIIRQAVTGESDPNATQQFSQELINNPFVEMNNAEKYATIFHFLGEYLRLLFFPHPLTLDYYPYHIPITQWTDLWAIVPVIIYLALGVTALLTIKKRSIYSFGICFFLITHSIYSNLIVQLGIFVNERFLYISSLGLCIIIAYFLFVGLPQLLQKNKIMNASLSTIPATIIIVVILGLYSYKTITRNSMWKDNETLFENDVKTSFDSAFSNFHYGSLIHVHAENEKDEAKQLKLYEKAMKHFDAAIKIHPTYKKALMRMANALGEYNTKGENYPQQLDSAMGLYKRLLKLNPAKKRVFENMSYFLLTYKNYKHRIKLYKELYAIKPYHYDVNFGLGMAYYETGNYKESIKYLKVAVKQPNVKAEAYNNLATSYYMVGQFEKSAKMFEMAIKLDPSNEQFKSNMELAKQQLRKRK